MALTYEPINTTTTTTLVTSVSIGSIPSTYDDLVLVVNASYGSGGGGDLNIRFNSDSSASSYAYNRMTNGAPITISVSTSNTNLVHGDATPNSVFVGDVLEYKNTSVYKTYMSFGGTITQNMGGTTGVWKNNAAIHTVSFYPEFSGSTWAIGSTFSIYGIKKA